MIDFLVWLFIDFERSDPLLFASLGFFIRSGWNPEWIDDWLVGRAERVLEEI